MCVCLSVCSSSFQGLEDTPSGWILGYEVLSHTRVTPSETGGEVGLWGWDGTKWDMDSAASTPTLSSAPVATILTEIFPDNEFHTRA